MKIKDYKCKCGHDDFFFSDNGNQTGIYCSHCGMWLKWADKNERNLRMKQEAMLDKIRNEIAEYGSIWVEYTITGHSDRDIENLIEDVVKQAKEQVLKIIDKYRTESEDKEGVTQCNN